MTIKQRHIEAFKAVMECGSISRAALVMNISQPAVTKTLQLFEAELGLTLFTRSVSGLTPTAEGRALYVEAQRIFTGLSYLKSYAQDLRGLKHGRMAIGAIPGLSETWLPDVVASFMAEFPEAALSLQTTSSPTMPQWVAERRVDLGIAQSAFEDVQIERQMLFSLDCVCLLPPGHRLTAREVITPADFEGEQLLSLSPGDHIRRETDRVLEAAGVRPARQIEVGLGSTIRALVLRGLGVAITDTETASLGRSQGLELRRFEPAIRTTIYLLRSRGSSRSLFEEKFIEHCLSHAPKSPF